MARMTLDQLLRANIAGPRAPAPTSLSGVYFDVLSGRLLVLRART